MSKSYRYAIPGEGYRLRDGRLHGTPSIEIEIKFPQVLENKEKFQAQLKSLFDEILEVCK
ncbi:hypothetical protein [Sporobacter termitidis]|nr:hypothetical protein [Sporobacter termitidis]